jgi:hypothetical protein
MQTLVRSAIYLMARTGDVMRLQPPIGDVMHLKASNGGVIYHTVLTGDAPVTPDGYPLVGPRL